jgi:hypothetical protein
VTKRIKWLMAGTVLCVMSTASAAATTEAPSVPAPSDLDLVPMSSPAPAQRRTLHGMPRSSVKLRVSTTKIPTAIRADATYVGVTQITPMLLARPVAVTLNPCRPLLLQALPLE